MISSNTEIELKNHVNWLRNNVASSDVYEFLQQIIEMSSYLVMTISNHMPDDIYNRLIINDEKVLPTMIRLTSLVNAQIKGEPNKIILKRKGSM